MKKKILISLVLLALLGAGFIGYLYLSGYPVKARATRLSQKIVELLFNKPPEVSGENDMDYPQKISSYCKDRNGTIGSKADPSGGETEVCNFEDGSFCELGDFFEGKCSPGGAESREALEAKAKEIARDWIVKNAKTYLYDGSELEYEGSLQGDCRDCFSVSYSFRSRQSGYGNRSNKIVLQIITPHKISVEVRQGTVSSAITDGVFDEINQIYLEGKEESGKIEGSFGYPGEAIPSNMVACAENIETKKEYCANEQIKDPRFLNGIGYSVEVPIGKYRVFAYLKDSKEKDKKKQWVNSYKAYYSEYVTCGLKSSCKSHEPIVVSVEGGKTTTGADPTDWYNHN